MWPANHCELPNRIWQIIADNNCHIGPAKDISNIKSSTTWYIQLVHISKLSPDFFILLNHQLECVIFDLRKQWFISGLSSGFWFVIWICINSCFAQQYYDPSDCSSEPRNGSRYECQYSFQNSCTTFLVYRANRYFQHLRLVQLELLRGASTEQCYIFWWET